MEQNPVVLNMMSQLEQIREKYGDAAFKEAAKEAARFLLRQPPELADVARGLLKDVVDFDELDREPKSSPGAKPANDFMYQQIRQQVPGIKTQAQFDVFMTSFDALRLYMNSTFLGDKEQAEKAKQVLLEGLDAAVTATELSQKLNEVPEAATSPEAEKFKVPPKELYEQEVQQSLLSELGALSTLGELNAWYLANKVKFDLVQSQAYRNELFDSVRQKKASLTG